MIDEKIAQSTSYYAGKPVSAKKDLSKISSKEKKIKKMFENKKTAESFLKCFSELP